MLRTQDATISISIQGGKKLEEVPDFPSPRAREANVLWQKPKGTFHEH